MVGINAIKARVKVAILAILPERAVSWKKIKRVMKPRIQSGIKICTRLTPGYLYRGILKLTYWKFLILDSSSFLDSMVGELGFTFEFLVGELIYILLPSILYKLIACLD